MKKVNHNIAEKYNKLFKEMAVYYKVSHLISKGIMDLSVIYAEYLGYGDGRLRDKEEFRKFMDWLETKYENFVPFYRFYLTLPKFTYIVFDDTMFGEINRVIEKIRKEKEIKTGKTNERNS